MSFHFRSEDTFCRIVELTPALRKRIEATIEHLVALLDQYDGNPDDEDNGDAEPLLGWPEAGGFNAVRRIAANDDREIEDENDEDGGDLEPDVDDECWP